MWNDNDAQIVRASWWVRGTIYFTAAPTPRCLLGKPGCLAAVDQDDATIGTMQVIFEGDLMFVTRAPPADLRQSLGGKQKSCIKDPA
jgi:hypothetical protein